MSFVRDVTSSFIRGHRNRATSTGLILVPHLPIFSSCLILSSSLPSRNKRTSQGCMAFAYHEMQPTTNKEMPSLSLQERKSEKRINSLMLGVGRREERHREASGENSVCYVCGVGKGEKTFKTVAHCLCANLLTQRDRRLLSPPIFSNIPSFTIKA